MKPYSNLYIDGAWVTPASDHKLCVINPADELIAAEVPAGNATDVDRAVEAASKAFVSWSHTVSTERRRFILAIADGMRARRNDLLAAISDTMGCPRHIAKWLQVDDPIEGFALFANHAAIADQTEEAGTSIVMREPVGVCAFINPWNFPLHQLIGKVGAALAAGCTMVVKPSEQTPVQDFIVAEIMHDVGLPPGVFNLVTGTGDEVGSALCTHPLVDMVSFTGSTRAGIKVAIAAAPTVKRIAQELGGKSPFIITEQADLPVAVKYGVEDVMLNSGQTCTALSRMLVPQKKYRQAAAIARELAEGMIVGMGDDAFLGAMSSAAQQKRVLEYIRLGVEEGATLVCGGTDQPAGIGKGFFVAPTIFADVHNNMRIAQEEIFGPVLCMIPYDELDDAIAIANDTPYGLSSGVFAETESEAISIAHRIRAGQCYINGGQFNFLAPFGGYKQSGNGREFSAEGVHEFLEVKAIQRP